MVYQRLVNIDENEVDWKPVQPNHKNKLLSVKTLLSSMSIASELSGLKKGAYPRSVGYQTVGELLEVDSAVKELERGDRILHFSGHTQYDYLNPENIIKIPEHISGEIALCAILGEDTDKGIRKITPDKHSKIIIFGAGLIGLLTLFNLSSRGFEHIDIIEPNKNRHQLAYDFGAQNVFDKVPQENYYTHGFECSASPDAFQQICDSMLSNGKICVLSDGNNGDFYLPPSFYEKELNIVGSSDGEDYQKYAEWLFDAPNHSLLKQLFEQTIHYEQLPSYYKKFEQLTNRPITTLVKWD